MSSGAPSSPFALQLAPQEFADGIVGPIMAGFCANMILYGVMLNFFLGYYQSESYTRDSAYAKSVMWATLALCSTVTALCVQSAYRYGVYQQRDLLTLLSVTDSLALIALFTGFTAFIVQGFLIHRASKLFQKQLYRTIFLGILGTVALLSLIACILTSEEIFVYAHRSKHHWSFSVVGGIWLCAAAAVDLFISVALFFTLRSHIAGFNKRTDSMLIQLIQIALQTAAYTAIPAVVGAILSLALTLSDLKSVNAPLAFWISLSPLYGLSIFTTLGARKDLQNQPVTPINFQPPTSAASHGDKMTTRSLNTNRLSKALTVTSEDV